MVQSKQDIVKKIAKLAEEHIAKKQLITKIFDDLDKEKDYGEKHIQGIAHINDIMKEIEAIEEEHMKLVIEAKKQ